MISEFLKTFVPKSSFSESDLECQTNDSTYRTYMMSPIHPAYSFHNQQKQLGLCGLENLGNTCFMNSALQCLSNIPELREYFLSDKYLASVNGLNPLGTGGRLAKAYANLLRSLWSGTSSCVRPDWLRYVISEIAPRFKGFSQQDSQEFTHVLLDGLHEDLNLIRIRPESPEKLDDENEEVEEDIVASERAWDDFKKSNDSTIVDLTYGQLKSSLTCSKCMKSCVKFEPFCVLSLPLPANHEFGKVLSLEECVELYTRQELQNADNMWFCPNCKSDQIAIRKLDIWSLPKILIVHLKRFGSAADCLHKIGDSVQFPLKDFTFTNLLTTPYKYDLIAVNNHTGFLNFGHYTALALNNGSWCVYDDSIAINCQDQIPSDRMTSREAYMLFYRRQDELDHPNVPTSKGVYKVQEAQKPIEHQPKTFFSPFSKFLPPLSALSFGSQINTSLEGVATVTPNMISDLKAVVLPESKKTSDLILALDLGNTHLRMAIWRDGQVKVLTHINGKSMMPSSVSFVGGGKYLFGDRAVNKRFANLGGTFYGLQRLIGKTFCKSATFEDSTKNLPYNVKSLANRPIIELYDHQSGETSLKYPKDIVARLIAEMRELAQKKLAYRGANGCGIETVVIAVPANSNQMHKVEVVEAAKCAGFSNVHLITGPVAAAFAHSHELDQYDDYKLLVVDFGGGKLDVAIIEVVEGEFNVIAVGGDSQLGGCDLDDLLVEYCAQQILELHKVDCQANKLLRQKLLVQCEKLKIILSDEDSACLELDRFLEIDQILEVTREKFEELCRPLLGNAVAIVQRILTDARMGAEEVEVLLLGGSSQTPLFKQMLMEELALNAVQFLNEFHEHESVVRGAAIRAAQLSGKNARYLPKINASESVPFSICLMSADDRFFMAFPPNSKIGDECRMSFKTLEAHQSCMHFEIYERIRDLFGSFTLYDLPPSAEGNGLSVDISLEFDHNGILKATALIDGREKQLNFDKPFILGSYGQMRIASSANAEKNTEDEEQLFQRIELENSFEEIIECQICCEEYALSDFANCQSSAITHAFCRTCLGDHARASLGEVPLADGGVGLRCMMTGCKNPIEFAKIRKFLPEQLLTQLELHGVDVSIREAGLEHLERCLKCNNVVEMCASASVVQVFRCFDCRYAFCRRCESPWDDEHIAVSCGLLRKRKVEKEIQIQLERERQQQMELEEKARELEEKRLREERDRLVKERLLNDRLSDAVIRKCQNCKRVLGYKSNNDGCNFITCPHCGATQCYLCRQIGVSHGPPHYCQCYSKSCGRCHLVDDTEKFDQPARDAVRRDFT